MQFMTRDLTPRTQAFPGLMQRVPMEKLPTFAHAEAIPAANLEMEKIRVPRKKLIPPTSVMPMPTPTPAPAPALTPAPPTLPTSKPKKPRSPLKKAVPLTVPIVEESDEEVEVVHQVIEEPVKRGRGRPRKLL